MQAIKFLGENLTETPTCPSTFGNAKNIGINKPQLVKVPKGEEGWLTVSIESGPHEFLSVLKAGGTGRGIRDHMAENRQ